MAPGGGPAKLPGGVLLVSGSSRARTALSAARDVPGTLDLLAKTREPRESSSRGSLLTGRLRSFVTVRSTPRSKLSS